MKKILIISSFPAPYRVDLFIELSKQYSVDTFFCTDKDQNRDKKFFKKNNSKFQFYLLNNIKGKIELLKKIISIKQYDAILLYDWYLSYSLFIILICLVKGIPYFINCDGAFSKDIKDNYIKYRIKKFFISHASLCFASGKNAYNYFLYYGAKKDNIKIHNFSSLHDEDLKNIDLSINNKTIIRNELQIKHMTTIISVGQFIDRKGYSELLQIWKKFDNVCQLYLIGGGQQKEEYKQTIKENNYKNVHIIDFVAREKIFDYYLAADIFVLPTKEDIWGLVINEALACGLLVVTTNRCIAGLELIKNSNFGYISELKNQSLIENIQKAIKNVKSGKRDKRQQIDLIKNYTIENVAKSHVKNITNFFEEITHENK